MVLSIFQFFITQTASMLGNEGLKEESLLLWKIVYVSNVALVIMLLIVAFGTCCTKYYRPSRRSSDLPEVLTSHPCLK